MAKTDWIKNWRTKLSSGKVQRLSLLAYKAFDTLCLMADEEGAIPEIEETAWQMRLTLEEAQKAQNELLAAGLIEEYQLDSDEPEAQSGNGNETEWNGGGNGKNDEKLEKAQRLFAPKAGKSAKGAILYRIHDWDDWQSPSKTREKSGSSTDRVRRFRELEKAQRRNGDVTVHETVHETAPREEKRREEKNPLSPPSVSKAGKSAGANSTPSFEIFWRAYGRKEDRRDAIVAFHRALERGCRPEQLIAAAAAYRASITDPRYQKLAATWLNRYEPENPNGVLPLDSGGVPGAAYPNWRSEWRDGVDADQYFWGLNVSPETVYGLWSRQSWLPNLGPRPGEAGCMLDQFWIDLFVKRRAFEELAK